MKCQAGVGGPLHLPRRLGEFVSKGVRRVVSYVPGRGANGAEASDNETSTRLEPSCVLCFASDIFRLDHHQHLGAPLPATQAGVEHTALIYNALNSAGERRSPDMRTRSPDKSTTPSLTGPPLQDYVFEMVLVRTYLVAVWQAEPC